MAVAIDNTGKSAGGTSVTAINITSFTISGTNRVAGLGVSQYSNPDHAPSGCTFNTSENFTSFDSVTIAESPGTRRVHALQLIAPSATTATIAVSWGGSTVDEAVAGAVSVTGANQTTPFTAVQKASSSVATSSSVTVASTSDGMVLSIISADGAGAASATANQTQRWRAIAASNTTEGAGQTAAGTGSNITCTWSNLDNGGGGTSAHIGFVVAAAGGGGFTAVDRRTKGSIGRVGSRRTW